ncbi:hypothetical protein D3C86_1982470 [compost metagenome]
MIAQLAGQDLQRHVTVAEVITGAGEEIRIGTAHDGHGFFCGDHFDNLATVIRGE